MKYTFIFSLQISSFTYHVIKQWYHFVDCFMYVANVWNILLNVVKNLHIFN